MAAVPIRRPPRDAPAPPAAGQLALATPPPAERGGGGLASAMQVLLPALGGLGTVMFVIANGNPLFLLGGVVLCVATLGGAAAMFVARRTGSRRQAALVRERYLAHLESRRAEVRAAADTQSAYSARVHPDPQVLAQLVRVPGRVFERRPGDPDFLRLRFGIGAVPAMLRAQVPASGSPSVDADPVCARAADALVAAHRVVPDQAVVLALDRCESVTVLGPAGEVRDLARALVAQVAANHAPDEVRLALCTPGATAEWEWAKWLPHLHDGRAHDGVSPRRWAAVGWPALCIELAEEWSARRAHAQHPGWGATAAPPRQRLIVVVDELSSSPLGTLSIGDDPDPPPWRAWGVHVLRLVTERSAEPECADVRIVVGGGLAHVDSPTFADGPGEGTGLPAVPGVTAAVRCSADRVDRAAATALARELAPMRVAADTVFGDPLAGTPGLAELIESVGAGQSGAGQSRSGRPHRRADRLRTPIGIRPDGTPLVLDLKESAQGGMGPHGICVGATGSGKSELLRTLVLGLASTHGPDELALILVDYKGGATFAGLEALPHCAGTITNLSDDLGLVDRMRDALLGEITRRQRILLEAGSVPDLAGYADQRVQDPALPALPSLLVIVDEFAELLHAKPEFIDLFTAIGRIGRSIGMHQLLASQRLDEGRLRGLESFLSYRIGLRTFNAEESRAVLGVPDAFELPPAQGAGYLKVDTTVFERFTAAFVSGPHQTMAVEPVRGPGRLVPFTLLNATPRSEPPPEAPERAAVDVDSPAGVPTVLDVAVRRLAGSAEPAHQVWLPPLPGRLALDDPRVTRTEGGWTGTRCPIGMVDLPTRQRVDPLVVDLAGATGHLAVLGAPRSGKSTLVRSLLLSSARFAAPREVGWHCVDLGGGGLAGLDGLPQVGTVADRLDLDRVRRVVGTVRAQLDLRERVFRAHGIDSAETLRKRWGTVPLPGIDVADLVLVVDNYAAVRTDHDDLHDALVDIAGRGLALGVHLVLTAGRFFDLRPALQAAVAGRIELRLNDPADSVLDRRQSVHIGTDSPGRALVSGGHLAQVASPGEGDGFDDAVAALARTYAGAAMPAVRMLPALLEAGGVDALEETVDVAAGPVVGVGERDLGPVSVEFDGADQHLVVIGDHGAGRTSLLRLLVQRTVRARTDVEVVFAVIDPRRSLLGEVPEKYLGAYAPTASAARALADSLAEELTRRLPGDGVTVAQLRNRSWWTGPEIVVLVDDYDLLFGALEMGSHPLDPLLTFLPQARDIGLHVVLTRHCGGAGRAFYEPLLQRLRELGATGLLLSASDEEGPLWPGVRCSSLPPGRGTWVRRGEAPQQVQLGFVPASELVSDGRVHSG